MPGKWLKNTLDKAENIFCFRPFKWGESGVKIYSFTSALPLATAFRFVAIVRRKPYASTTQSCRVTGWAERSAAKLSRIVITSISSPGVTHFPAKHGSRSPWQTNCSSTSKIWVGSLDSGCSKWTAKTSAIRLVTEVCFRCFARSSWLSWTNASRSSFVLLPWQVWDTLQNVSSPGGLKWTCRGRALNDGSSPCMNAWNVKENHRRSGKYPKKNQKKKNFFKIS